jgi:hypothetical protein
MTSSTPGGVHSGSVRHVVEPASRVAREITPHEVLARGITMIGDTPNMDVLTRAWNVLWTDASRDFVVFQVDGVAIPTISLPPLIASKRTGRSTGAGRTLREPALGPPGPPRE